MSPKTRDQVVLIISLIWLARLFGHRCSLGEPARGGWTRYLPLPLVAHLATRREVRVVADDLVFRVCW
jgi:hypothetical protein